tara:strand:- start:272 stop:1138 length:867 start_codon:yes stop_codon:yes gene_type:complete
MYKISPLARKIIKKNNINIDKVKGSGPDGRIIKRDLKDFLFDHASDDDYASNNKSLKEITPSQMRKAIAEKTVTTFREVPHFYLKIESNISKLILLKDKINNSKNNDKVSLNDLFVKALGIAQKQNPKTRVSWINDKIIKYSNVDISVAVALDDGLITPVITDVDKKGIFEISKELKNLIKKAKNGSLKPSEYSGGTISLSNLGMFGISEFGAIINSPQSCILAIGNAKKQPIIENNEIKQAIIMKSTLSADHRVLDGSTAANLLKDFNSIIENPIQIWIESKDITLN